MRAIYRRHRRNSTNGRRCAVNHTSHRVARASLSDVCGLPAADFCEAVDLLARDISNSSAVESEGGTPLTRRFADSPPPGNLPAAERRSANVPPALGIACQGRAGAPAQAGWAIAANPNPTAHRHVGGPACAFGSVLAGCSGSGFNGSEAGVLDRGAGFGVLRNRPAAFGGPGPPPMSRTGSESLAAPRHGRSRILWQRSCDLT